MGKDPHEHSRGCIKQPFVKPPKEWKCINSEGPGPFITKALFKNKNGLEIFWESRKHRINHSLIWGKGSLWWAPGELTWWVGILFAVGAFFFGLAAFPPFAKYVGFTLDGMVFFIGSWFFTVAAFLQYLEMVNTPHKLNSKNRKLKIFTWEPARIDWWSTVVQLAGTLFFNLSTLLSFQQNLTVQSDAFIWTPDAFGSVCFLIASYLAWAEFSNHFWSKKWSNISWWITFLNLLGSMAFGVSAVGGFVVPTTGVPIDVTLVNIGTLIGSFFFFVAALMLLPERVS